MQKLILGALIACFLAGCAATPQSEVDYAATLNKYTRVWPPVVPGQAVPPQDMDRD